MSETATRSPIEERGRATQNPKPAKRYIAERYEVVNTLEGVWGWFTFVVIILILSWWR